MYKWIPFNQLAKAEYNRGIERAHLNEIKNGWTDDLKQPVIVSFRDGKYWIIDHQHQATAEYELNEKDPNTLIYCDVRTGLTYEQEAKLYYRLNTSSKRLKFNDELKGLIEAKDTTALHFRDIVEKNGYLVGGNASNSLKAVTTAYRIFKKVDGDKRLNEILELTNKCWPGNTDGVHTHMINGIALFLEKHRDEYSRDQFAKALSPQNPKDIVRKGQVFCKQMNIKSFTNQYCTYTVICNSYNTGLRSNKLSLVSADC